MLWQDCRCWPVREPDCRTCLAAVARVTRLALTRVAIDLVLTRAPILAGTGRALVNICKGQRSLWILSGYMIVSDRLHGLVFCISEWFHIIFNVYEMEVLCFYIKKKKSA